MGLTKQEAILILEPMLDKNIERRRYPRGRGDVDYLFAVQVEDIVTETKNISVGGMLCKVNRFFKSKSIVHMTFILPTYSGEHVSFDKIKCKARVVHCESVPEIDDPDCHAMGLEFTNLTPTQKSKIARFVKHATATEKKGQRHAAVSVKITPHKSSRIA